MSNSRYKAHNTFMEKYTEEKKSAKTFMKSISFGVDLAHIRDE